jgi:hypothetical protein
VGTHGLLFTPQAALPGSTRFMVTVAAGARSLAGDSLPADYTFSFFTEPATVLSATPYNGAQTLRADGAFRLNFNQRMNPDAVAQKAHVWVRAKAGDNARSIGVRATHPKSELSPFQTLAASC